MGARGCEAPTCCLTSARQCSATHSAATARRVDLLPGRFWPSRAPPMCNGLPVVGWDVAGLQRGVFDLSGRFPPRLRASSGDLGLLRRFLDVLFGCRVRIIFRGRTGGSASVSWGTGGLLTDKP